MILDLCIKYHREINPNTSCSWTIGTLSCGTYILIIFTLAIAFNCPISCQEMYLFLLPLSSLTLVIPFDFVKLVLCYFYVGICDDPTCVHFVFKCKIVNNALILGELSYIFITHSLCLFQLVWVVFGRQIFSFWYFVCHHKKCGEFSFFI
jgi:hypothetical protein